MVAGAEALAGGCHHYQQDFMILPTAIAAFIGKQNPLEGVCLIAIALLRMPYCGVVA